MKTWLQNLRFTFNLYCYTLGYTRFYLTSEQGLYNPVGRCTLCILLTPTSSSYDWLEHVSTNEKA